MDNPSGSGLAGQSAGVRVEHIQRRSVRHLRRGVSPVYPRMSMGMTPPRDMNKARVERHRETYAERNEQSKRDKRKWRDVLKPPASRTKKFDKRKRTTVITNSNNKL